MLLFSCSDEDKNKVTGITGISLNKPTINLVAGDSEQLTAVLNPENVKGTIKWETTDATIATVTDGLVKALKEGTTIITASCEGFSAPCIVSVTLEPSITSIIFPDEVISMNVKDIRKIIPVVEPVQASGSSLTWVTDNERVVTVSSTGEIQAIGFGKTTVTAFFENVKATCVIEVAEPIRSYKLIWSDEFDGEVLDMTKWSYDIGGGGWGNQELQYYTDRTDNTYLKDGYLIIEGKRENYENRNYTSGKIVTKGKLDITYGKIEARIALPSGKGTWPAFWMMPTESVYGGWPRSGEIDIMEHVGAEPDMISHAVHTKARNAGSAWSHRTYYNDPVEDVFVTYTVEWINDYYNGNDAFIFYVDGVQTIIKDQASWKVSTEDDWPFDQDFFIILNLAIGGSWGGTVDNTIFDTPLQMKVDYVRVYQLED